MDSSIPFSRALRAFYDQAGIGVKSFTCPHQEFCTSAASPRPLSHGMEAHVGSKYGVSPRVVVVSLDSGGDSNDLRERREIIEGLVFQELNPHMKGTTELLEIILSYALPDDANPYEYFAMTNAAKCSGSDDSSDKVPWDLYKKCQHYSFRELEILEPDLIITQGNYAFSTLGTTQEFPLERVRAACNKMDISSFVQDWLIALTNEYLRVLIVKEVGPVTVLRTPHPSARDGRWQLFIRIAIRPLSELIKSLKA